MHNEKYSYRDFLQHDLRETNALDWTGEVVGSCFQQDRPRTPVFPDDATCTFVRCNLNNCEIPKGCKVDKSCCHHQHEEQNDGEQWILDKQNRPAKPLGEKQFDRLKLSKNSNDIPDQKQAESATVKAERHQRNRKEILELRRRADELDAVTPIVRIV